MNNSHRLIVAAFGLAMFVASTATVQAQLDYEINNGTVTITGGCPNGALTIPDTIDGLPVTSIGYWAFWLCTSMTSATIPNSVTSIEERAFEHCSSLTSITIPNSVTSIGQNTFAYCEGLTAINVEPHNPAYSSPEGVLFNKSQTTLMQCPGGKVGSYIVPNGVTSIGESAFGGCPNLTNVTIGNSVTSIGVSAFAYSHSLNNITIGDSVTSIGDAVFFQCSSLTTITFPNSLTSIGGSAFEGCTNLSREPFPRKTGHSSVGLRQREYGAGNELGREQTEAGLHRRV